MIKDRRLSLARMIFMLSICWAALLAPGAHLVAGAEPAADAAQPTQAAVQSQKLTLQQQFLKDSQATEMLVGSVSEAYAEDPSNPALKLERMWAAESGTLLELRGLPRRGQQYSALIQVESLMLRNLQTDQLAPYIASDGGLRFEDRGGKKLLRVLPNELIYVFFAPIDSIQAHSLTYKNSAGLDDTYFDRIDPRFRDRYDQMYAKAVATDGSVEDMKGFLLGFVRQDPEQRVQKVFVSLIGKLRSQRTFEGHYQAYLLIKDPADEKAARQLAKNDEQISKLEAAVEANRQIAAEKQAQKRRAEEARREELRKREEARMADLRRQAEVRAAEDRQRQAQADESRCMQSALCRGAVQERQAMCQRKIESCRGGCDRLTGSGGYGGFFANMAAAAMARACYAGCQCDGGIGDLVDKFNQHSPSSTVSSPSRAVNKTFECKIYCKSASGPVIFTSIEAGSRRQAADLAAKQADQVCAASGKSHASSVKFSESQCREQ
jgi:hypothetical protein